MSILIYSIFILCQAKKESFMPSALFQFVALEVNLDTGPDSRNITDNRNLK